MNLVEIVTVQGTKNIITKLGQEYNSPVLNSNPAQLNLVNDA